MTKWSPFTGLVCAPLAVTADGHGAERTRDLIERYERTWMAMEREQRRRSHRACRPERADMPIRMLDAVREINGNEKTFFSGYVRKPFEGRRPGRR